MFNNDCKNDMHVCICYLGKEYIELCKNVLHLHLKDCKCKNNATKYLDEKKNYVFINECDNNMHHCICYLQNDDAWINYKIHQLQRSCKSEKHNKQKGGKIIKNL